MLYKLHLYLTPYLQVVHEKNTVCVDISHQHYIKTKYVDAKIDPWSCVFPLLWFVQSWPSFWTFHCWPLCLCPKDRDKCGTIVKGDGFQALLCHVALLTPNSQSVPIQSHHLFPPKIWGPPTRTFCPLQPSPFPNFKYPVSVSSRILPPWSPSFILGSTFSLLLPPLPSEALHFIIIIFFIL